MPNENENKSIVKRAQELIDQARVRRIHLGLTGYRFDDGWLYLVVEPTERGQRASEQAHLMTEIERTLQREGFDQVLLVPTVPEHEGLTAVPPPAA